MVERSDTGDDDTEVDREAILARRQRFVTATLAGLATSTLATACPCLKTMPAEPATEPASERSPDAEDVAENEDEVEQDDGDAVEEASPADGEIPDDPGE